MLPVRVNDMCYFWVCLKAAQKRKNNYYMLILKELKRKESKTRCKVIYMRAL